MLYRFIPFDPEAGERDEGGPLFVPRALQGGGRHDNPDRYGALYASRDPVSVVAEHLRRYERQEVTARDLRWERALPYAVAALDDRGLPVVDLDDPEVLSGRGLRPSGVATRDRERTQAMALGLYEEGTAGFEWWSAIEASWINVTLFADRTLDGLRAASPPEPLTPDHPAVRAAAEVVGVLLP